MSLFRSEESVRAWSDFDPATEKAIKPVREWANMFTGADLFTRRLENDFVEKSEAYANAALGALAAALT
jgi:hypothetical protein